MSTAGAGRLREVGWLVCLLAGLAPRAWADEPFRLQERFPVGYQYHVRVRVELSGSLSLPEAKGKPAPAPITLRGDSAMDYDERVLAVGTRGEVSKTLRICRRLDIHRTVAGQPQESTLRPSVRRLVVLRQRNTEVPFSPDGPLTWGEIDQVRTDVFTPGLAGLLPDRTVRLGDAWTAATDAVLELTDMEKIEEGSLECRLERLEATRTGQAARVAFRGTVRGTNEDGPNRQQLTGHLLFDLGTRSLSYLHLNGVSSLLDADGKEVGRTEGRFVLTREVNTRAPELADETLRGLVTEPNADNTRLLYENPDLGVRFVYPRRWRVGAVRGSQVILDGADGSGLLLTLDPLARVPTGGQFLAESRAWLEKQKARILRVVPPDRLRDNPALDSFAIQADLGGEFWMAYFVTRQEGGGATLAARLLPRDLDETRREVDRLARSIVITKTIQERPEGKK